MDPVLRLQIDPIAEQGWLVTVASPLGQAARATATPEQVQQARGRVERLWRGSAPGPVLAGRDLVVSALEETAGQTLGEAVFQGPTAAELAHARGLARGEPLLLAIDTRDPQVRALPWELVSADGASLPLEVSGAAVLARLVQGTRTPRATGELAVHVVVADPEDPTLAALAARVEEELTKHALPRAGAAPDPDATLVLVVICHGQDLRAGFSLGTGDLAPNTLLHRLQPLIARSELVVLGVCDGARGTGRDRDGWAARFIEAGARACLAPAGQLRLDAAGAMMAGLFQAIARGASTPAAVAEARRTVRAMAHPARAARWHNLMLSVGSLGPWTPLLRPLQTIPGWPRPGPDTAELLRKALDEADARADGYFGVEHLLMAFAELPHTGRVRRVAEPAALRARERLGGMSAQDHREPLPTLRMARIGARLPPAFDRATLWSVLEEEAWPLLNCLLFGPDTANTRDTSRSVEQRAAGLEVVGGPEDGRRIYLAPNETLGRHDEPARADHTLYRGTAYLDQRLSRRQIRWLGEGLVQLLHSPEPPIGLRVGQLLHLSSRTTLLGLAAERA